MKLTIERAALLRSLAHVQSVVERRNTIPILSNVLIEASGELLSLKATDMDLTIVEQTAANVSEPGATTAPAHTLYDIIRKLPDGSEVELSTGGESGQLTLRAGRSNFSLQTLPKEDFPSTGSEELPRSFELGVEETKALIDRTRFAISTEETRYYLNGIYFHAAQSDNGEVLRAVATDGHRLARFEMTVPGGAEGMQGVIVPRKAINEIRKLIDEAEGMIEVSLSDTQIRTAFGDTVLTSKLIDGTFPDYNRVIPQGNDKMMGVDCKVFAQAVDRVSTISTEKSRAIKMALNGQTMTLSATSPDNGRAEEDVAIEYDGPKMEIGFNSRYLLDIASQIEGGAARFALADSSSPTVVSDQDDTGALYVLMPMRV